MLCASISPKKRTHASFVKVIFVENVKEGEVRILYLAVILMAITDGFLELGVVYFLLI